ncbi:MAG: histidine triad nucleotide-binding protein [Clostridiales bacterium]|nr:histidine triad nucleotide-binding protein [Clostridiales bacterium]
MCLFCEIINGNFASDKVYEDDMIYAFRDINPAAPVHVLVVPKIHIDSVNSVDAKNSKYVAHIFEKIPEIAKKDGIESYRIICNCGKDAGQTVMHLHFHILGGVELGEKIL